MSKVAVIAKYYGRTTGVGRVTVEVVERYANDGNEVHVFCTGYDECLVSNSKIASIRIVKVTKVGILSPIHYFLKTFFLIDNSQFDLVYSAGEFYYKPDLVTIHMLDMCARKALDRTKSISLPVWKRVARAVYMPLIYELPQRIVYHRKKCTYIAVSKGVKREYESVFGMGQTVQTIENGVDSNEMHYCKDARQRIRNQHSITMDAKVFLFAGSEWNLKRIRLAIQIISFIPEAILLVVGRGNWEKEYQYCCTLGCDNRIIYIGTTKYIQEYYSAADFFLFTSIYKTFGLVALEAMACGAIVFSARLNGVEDFIKHGVNGFICEGDVSSFVNVINSVIHDNEKQNLIRKQARLTAESMNWDNVYLKYKKVFDDVMLQKRRKTV